MCGWCGRTESRWMKWRSEWIDEQPPCVYSSASFWSSWEHFSSSLVPSIFFHRFQTFSFQNLTAVLFLIFPQAQRSFRSWDYHLHSPVFFTHFSFSFFQLCKINSQAVTRLKESIFSLQRCNFGLHHLALFLLRLGQFSESNDFAVMLLSSGVPCSLSHLCCHHHCICIYC